MEYFKFLPPRYIEAVIKLKGDLIECSTIQGKKEIFNLFSEKYTVFPYLWIKRINFEKQLFEFSYQGYLSCLELEKMAYKHFYHPCYLSNYPMPQIEKCKKLSMMGEYNYCYRLPEVDNIDSYCITLNYEVSSILQYQRLQKYLTFPHSQLRAFLHHYQFKSPIPLPNKIQKMYSNALESYDYMVSIAMEPKKWLEWMQQNFIEIHWIRNLEAKLGEHWFMHSIWNFYIDFLNSNNDIEVLNVYKRYCRLFIEEKVIQERYGATTLKYLKLGYDVSQWMCDQAKFEYDFGSKELGQAQLKPMLEKFDICKKCYAKSNEMYFQNEIQRRRRSWFSVFLGRKVNRRCCVCIDGITLKETSMFHFPHVYDRQQYFDSLRQAKSIISVSYKPIIKLQFRDSLQPPIPVSILDYIIENTNHEVLAKLYKTCKYFFVKKLILFCHQLHVCKSSPQTFVKNSCVTPFLTLLKHPFIEKFCCQILIFHDSENRNYLSASLSKICFCSLKCLQIGGQDLTMEEFLMVIDGGKLRQVNLENVQIFKCNGNIMFVEEIVELLPTVVALALRHNFAQMFTERTAQTLASLNRSTKFESFELDQIPGDFAIFFLEKFIKNNMAPKARIKIRLNPNANLNLELRFFCNAVVYKWRPVYEAPQINFEE